MNGVERNHTRGRQDLRPSVARCSSTLEVVAAPRPREPEYRRTLGAHGTPPNNAIGGGRRHTIAWPRRVTRSSAADAHIRERGDDARRCEPFLVATGGGGERRARPVFWGAVRVPPYVYFSFFFGRSWLLWPQIFLRQLTARGGKRA